MPIRNEHERFALYMLEDLKVRFHFLASQFVSLTRVNSPSPRVLNAN